ncbi:MAG: hypothetical protein O3C21_16980 [Verrucomicrobia bacterium]|nr:hypothetical protein [Verrucomicrobiota bacterium]
MAETTAIHPNATPVDDGAPIECPVARWYYKRMGLMFMMLFAMGCWFLYDATIGYPAKKEIWDQYTEITGYDLKLVRELKGAEELPKSGVYLAIIGKTADGRHYRVFDGKGEMKLDLAGESEAAKKMAITKLDKVLEAKWAEADTLAADEKQEILSALSPVINFNVKGAQKDSDGMEKWRALAKEKGWEQEPEEYTDSKIKTQWEFTIGMFVLSLIVVVVFLLNKGKVLKADSEAFYQPDGSRVTFASVYRIDRRKWDHKGLAYAMYRTGGEGRSRKATIDDLKFLGADRILTRLLNNFEGELIDRVPDEEEDEQAVAEEEKVADSKADVTQEEEVSAGEGDLPKS